jgi:hypothetical protein
MLGRNWRRARLYACPHWAHCGAWVECVASEDFNDDVRLMYCLGSHQLNARFLRIVSEMATKLSFIAVRPDALECDAVDPVVINA